MAVCHNETRPSDEFVLQKKLLVKSVDNLVAMSRLFASLLGWMVKITSQMSFSPARLVFVAVETNNFTKSAPETQLKKKQKRN